MNILILGGTLFVGPHIARQLIALGHTVTVFHRDPARRGTPHAPRSPYDAIAERPPLPAGAQELFGNRKQLAAAAEALRSARPDVIIDMLCFTRNDARVLLEVFPGSDRRLVIASSQDVYRAFGFVLRQDPTHTPEFRSIAEDAPLRESRFPHGRAPDASDDDTYEKIFVEETLRAGDPAATILRMPATYGPHDPVQRVWQFLHQMEHKRPAILLDPDYANWRWTAAYVENVAHAFVLAATRPEAAGETYNVGEPKTPTTAERAHHIARLAKYRGQILALPKARVPPHLAMAECDFRQDLVLSSEKIRSQLGYEEIVSEDDSLRRTIEWDRAHPQDFRGQPQPDIAAEDALLASLGLLPRKK